MRVKWQNPELVYPPVDEWEDPPVVEKESLWKMPVELGRALVEIFMEAYGERERTLDDIGWIMHELDGLD